jgi:hypothetical protein
MVRTETPHSVCHVLDFRPAIVCVHTSNDFTLLGEGEQRRPSPSSSDKAEGTIPNWDNLWVDLGGEG